SFKLFQGIIKRQYDAMARKERFVVIDSTQPIDEMQQEVRRIVAGGPGAAPAPPPPLARARGRGGVRRGRGGGGGAARPGGGGGARRSAGRRRGSIERTNCPVLPASVSFLRKRRRSGAGG